jgi:tight adherence protein B
MKATAWARRLAGATLSMLVLAALPSSTAVAQSEEFRVDEVDDSDYPIVEVTVAVPAELAETRLSKEAFGIVEDGRQVQPYLGSSEEAEPSAPNVVLAIDTSGSMEGEIEEVRRAATDFVRSLPSDSEIAIVTFGDRPKVLVEQTSLRSSVLGRIATIDVRYNAGTALYDGVVKAASLLNVGDGETGTVVVLSDGVDSDGGASEDDALAAIERSRIDVWAIQLGNQVDRESLLALAGDGTKVLTAADSGDLGAIYSGLASTLSTQYVLRYNSEASGETDLSVSLDVGTIRSERQLAPTIDGTPSNEVTQEGISAVSSDSFVVRVPLIGTTGAFVAALTALAVGAFVLLLLLLSPRPVDARTRLIIGGLQTGEHAGARLTSLAQWTTDVADRRLRRGEIGQRMDHALESAGLDVRPGELVVTIASAMVVLFAIGFVAGSALLGVTLAVLVPVAVRLWLGMRRDKRQAAFSEQLTDVLQLIGSSLRAGYGLTQGIDAVSRDAEEPSASEFRRIVVEHRLGRDLNEAMDNCARRMDNADFAWVVQAIGIHRDVGGDLAKVLDNIISTIRDRADIHRQVRALSAEGRLSARMLLALPILVLGFLLTTNSEYLTPMLRNPLGWLLFGVAALLMGVGTLVIRRIATIRY